MSLARRLPDTAPSPRPSPARPPLPASSPLQHRIGHEGRHRLSNRGIVGALQLVLARQQEIDRLLTEFDLDRPQPQPPAFPRFRTVQVELSEQVIDFLPARKYELERSDNASIAVSAFVSDAVLEWA